jgi:hypothetical protein
MAPGDGQELRSIEPFTRKFRNAKPDSAEVRLLHRSIFGLEGDHKERKKDILAFRGLKAEPEADTPKVCSEHLR